MVVRKAVIPVAGSGTRLYPTTKAQPKEMLPIFYGAKNGNISVKPMVQIIFELLYNVGFREFCFVVGEGKRVIEDHFMPDFDCIRRLEEKGKKGKASELEAFYKKLSSSTIMWVNQPERKGFGHAVSMAQPFVQNERCLVHAGDGYLLSSNMDYLNKLIEVSERLKPDAVFPVLEIEKPKQYGIVKGDEMEDNILKVRAMVEKPERPESNYAIMAMYIFHPRIFEALKVTKPGKYEEIQLTDAVQKLIDRGLKVYAVKLNKKYKRLDIGNPRVYWKALKMSYEHFCPDFT